MAQSSEAQRSNIPLPFRIGNLIYKNCFSLYRPLYHSYKRFSDREMIALIRRDVGLGDKVLDIGGNIGFYTRLLSREVGPEGRVYSFEPDEENFRHLERAVAGLGNTTLRKCAVGDQSGNVKLYHSDDLNIDHQTFDSGEGRSYTEVESVTLDDVFSSGEKIDFIKMDIQGFDYFALKGMRELIARSDGIRVMGEYWPHGLEAASIEPTSYLDLLEEMGFSLQFFGKGSDKPRDLPSSPFCYIDFYGKRGS